MSSVAPPSEAIAVVWLTRRSTSLPSVSLAVQVARKVASRVALTRPAMRSIAQSSVLVLSHSVAPGARYQTLVTRFGLTTSWYAAAPLGQRVPPLIGLSGLPSMLTILPPRTLTSWLQPTAQYGQTLGYSRVWANLKRLLTSCCAARRSAPRPSRPPREKPPRA